jgi:hypothetical protein
MKCKGRNLIPETSIDACVCAFFVRFGDLKTCSLPRFVFQHTRLFTIIISKLIALSTKRCEDSCSRVSHINFDPTIKFQPIQSVPAKRQTQIPETQVSHILTVPNQQEAGTNYWCIYLSTSLTTSTKLDCHLNYSVSSSNLQGSKAELILSELPHETESDTQANIVLDIAPGLLVGRN